mgnify:CR=1 FL=1|tara:strand:+ start:1167 stop:2066 length:900 start_codon:yes stop_codon:yes gene_type:complete
MTSKLETCANASARPASPAAGDTLFQEDIKQIIVWDGSAWYVYSADNATGYDLDGTNSTTAVPLYHFDAEKFNGIDTSGNPSDATTIDTSVVWQSRIGNVFASQATAADQPQYKTSGTNSKPYILSNQDYLVTNKAFRLDGPFTVFAVVEATSSSQVSFIANGIEKDGSSYESEYSVFFAYSGNKSYVFYNDSGAAIGDLPLTLSGGDMRTFIIPRNSSNQTKVFMDGNNEDTNVVGTNTNPVYTGFLMGGEGGLYTTIGNTYEIALFDSDLSTADRNALGAYVQAKYGSGNAGWTNFS